MDLIEKYLDEGKRKQYPELMEIVYTLAKDVSKKINKETAKVKSEMPYKAQYVLEELITILQAAV